MGEKFDKLIGKMKIKIDGVEYPFALSIRQRGHFDNLRSKQDMEAILLFLYDRFKDGYIEDQKNAGVNVTIGQMGEYEPKLDAIFMTKFSEILNEVLVELGIIKRAVLDNINKQFDKMEDSDFLSNALERKTGLK